MQAHLFCIMLLYTVILDLWEVMDGLQYRLGEDEKMGLQLL